MPSGIIPFNMGIPHSFNSHIYPMHVVKMYREEVPSFVPISSLLYGSSLARRWIYRIGAYVHNIHVATAVHGEAIDAMGSFMPRLAACNVR